jgi:hypothetical protein
LDYDAVGVADSCFITNGKYNKYGRAPAITTATLWRRIVSSGGIVPEV